MSFVLKKNPTFKKEVDVYLPTDKKAGFDKSTLTVEFRLATRDEFLGETKEEEVTEWIADADGIAREVTHSKTTIIKEGLIHKVGYERLATEIVGFSDLVDDEGAVIEFSQASLFGLLQVVQFIAAADAVWWESINKKSELKAKN
jgi:hypothetical protein